jgi:hypothetical protein
MNVIGGMIELGFPCLEYFGKPEFILKGVVIPGDWGLIKRTWSLSLFFFFKYFYCPSRHGSISASLFIALIFGTQKIFILPCL